MKIDQRFRKIHGINFHDLKYLKSSRDLRKSMKLWKSRKFILLKCYLSEICCGRVKFLHAKVKVIAWNNIDQCNVFSLLWQSFMVVEDPCIVFRRNGPEVIYENWRGGGGGDRMWAIHEGEWKILNCQKISFYWNLTTLSLGFKFCHT